MTQDQTSQERDTGYVRGEVVADETEAFPDEQPRTMTTFQKVASAFRGDRAEQDDPDEPARDQAIQDQPASDQEAPREPVTASQVAAGSDGMGPDTLAGAGTGAYAPPVGGTYPDEAAEQDPSMTRPDAYGTSMPPDTGAIRTPYPHDDDQAGTAADYGSQAGTAGGPSSQPGTTPGYGSQPGSDPGYGTEVGTAARHGSRDVTATSPMGQAGTGPAATGVNTGEPGVAGRHAAGAADAGLRPGEATDRLGDFGDIAFGNLLPDAERYSAQWQQIQFRFVDDPQGSVTEAAEVISQVTAKLEAAIQERQRAIEDRQRAIQERASALRGRWGEGSNADTETLRETLRMYRAFMDQLVGPTP
jgi:hypothetical protein